jgi:type IV pilus assembly protein PilC
VSKRKRPFFYRGYTLNGDPVSGIIRQYDRELAKTELHHQGIQSVVFSQPNRLGWLHRLSARDCYDFTRQLSVLLQAELPLLQTLDLLSRSLKHPGWVPVVAQLRQDVSQGQSLAEAFRAHPQYFNTLFCSLIAAGEQAGTLGPMCTRLVHHQQRTQRLQQQVRETLRYPLIVLTIAIGLSLFLIIQVVPAFADVFLGFSSTLPPLTARLIGLADSMQNLSIAGVGIGLLTLGGCMLLWRQPRWQAAWRGLSFTLPVLGRLQHYAAIAHLSHTLSLALGAGVPILHAVGLAIEASQQPKLMAQHASIEASLSAGNSLHEVLANATELPDLFQEMIQTGEQSGMLVPLLERAGHLYDEELELQIKRLTTWLEPLVMLLLAVMIGGLLLALYLPIFSMGSLL